MDVRKPNYLFGFVVLLAGLAFVMYNTLPALLLRFDSRRSPGTITDLNAGQLTYRYRNAFDGETYTVSRYVSLPAYQALGEKQQLTVCYPRYFPEEAQIVEVDLPPVLLPSVLGILVLVGCLWQVGKQLRTRA
jgi:hypothetical protein